jgi:hypothetical protein
MTIFNKDSAGGSDINKFDAGERRIYSGFRENSEEETEY